MPPLVVAVMSRLFYALCVVSMVSWPWLVPPQLSFSLTLLAALEPGRTSRPLCVCVWTRGRRNATQSESPLPPPAPHVAETSPLFLCHVSLILGGPFIRATRRDVREPNPTQGRAACRGAKARGQARHRWWRGRRARDGRSGCAAHVDAHDDELSARPRNVDGGGDQGALCRRRDSACAPSRAESLHTHPHALP
jgi:hypothetical protein